MSGTVFRVGRSVGRGIGRGIGRQVGNVSFDPSAFSYFTAVEAAGGSFDLTAVDGYDSDFSAGVDGWAFASLTGDGNIDVAGQADSLRMTLTGGSVTHFAARNGQLTVGENYEVSFDVYIPSSNTKADNFGIGDDGGSQWITPAATKTLDAWTSYTATANALGTKLRFSIYDGLSFTVDSDGDVIYIRNIQVRNTAYSTYDAPTVKQAHSDFYAGLKSDGVWDKLTEFYLLTGKTFGGITVKGKERAPNGLEYASDFSAGVDGTSAINGTVDGNIDGIGGRDDNLRFTINTISSSNHTVRLLTSLSIGSTYEFSFDIYIPSSNDVIDGFRVTNAVSDLNDIYSSQTLDSWISVSGSATTTVDNIQVRAMDGASSTVHDPTGTDVLYIRNITVTETKAPALTNNNFVTGDYLPAGTGAGLTGDGSTKYLDTGLLQSAIGANDSHLSGYVTSTSAGTYDCLIGARRSNGTDTLYLTSVDPATTIAFTGKNTATPQATIPNGMLIGSNVSGTQDLYSNGTSQASDSSGTTITPYAGNIYINALNSGGFTVDYGAHTPTFLSAGSALDATDASNLSARVNTLMTSLGCNTY